MSKILGFTSKNIAYSFFTLLKNYSELRSIECVAELEAIMAWTESLIKPHLFQSFLFNITADCEVKEHAYLEG